MKNNPKLLMLFAFPLILASCGGGGGETSTQSAYSTAQATSSYAPSTSETSTAQQTLSESELSSAEKTNMEKALEVISSFDIENTNGYDYSLTQYLGMTVTNEDVISLRADFSGSPIGQKDITTKRLNEYGAGEQFTTTTETNYFSNNMIAEYKNGKWVWSNCRKADYFKIAVSDISFDPSLFTSVRESLNTNYVLMADVPDEKVASFFGVSETTINSLSITITVDASFSKLEGIKLSYLQKTTRSEMTFDAYYGDVSIRLPN